LRANLALDDEIQSRLLLSGSRGNCSTERDDDTVVTADCENDERRRVAIEMLRDLDVRVIAEDRPRVDWLGRYEQSLEPLLIGRSFVVAPDRSLIRRDSDRIAIIIPQQQAFGTGAHETTALCLEMLERIDVKNKRGLDIGTGTGLLAIAMQLLGARKVIAFDNDLDAFGPLRENRRRNSVDGMPVFIGSIDSLRDAIFDVVTINIIPEVIVAMIGRVRTKRLILSGILTIKRDDVVAAASAHGFALEREDVKGEWWAGMFASG